MARMIHMDALQIDLAVKACVMRTWDTLRKLYPQIQTRYPAVKYNNRLKTTAGRAFYDSNPQYIDLSVELLREHTQYFLVDTIPHELAHLVAYTVYGDTGHGTGWKRVMVELGLKPERCHSMVNSMHAARKAKCRF